MHHRATPAAARPAWFNGSEDEYLTLTDLLQRMQAREAERRRRLFGRSAVLLVSVLGASFGLNRLVLASGEAVAAPSLLPLYLTTALLGLMVLVEFLRFMESHLQRLDLHLGFARLASELVSRMDVPDTLPDDDPSTPLHTQLRAFAHAHRAGKVMMPSLLTAGFTPRPRYRADRLPLF
ncbi:hypothetical protein [Azoarcus olearius]|uniref:Hypothetical membrane protein n=1 Tax=Azoarcus sp. (strain BH72) TaxID=418699 RepID=A1K5M0_AZOSB|nr:hypothetical protein [Azoarcus olearius]CAL94125.1 hypothetical membrane protein [Azoarcus olearius]